MTEQQLTVCTFAEEKKKKNKQLHCQIILYTNSSKVQSLTGPANSKSKDSKQGNRAVRQAFSRIWQWQNHCFLCLEMILKLIDFLSDVIWNVKDANAQNLLLHKTIVVSAVGIARLIIFVTLVWNGLTQPSKRVFLQWKQCWLKEQICYSFRLLSPPLPKETFMTARTSINSNTNQMRTLSVWNW